MVKCRGLLLTSVKFNKYVKVGKIAVFLLLTTKNIFSVLCFKRGVHKAYHLALLLSQIPFSLKSTSENLHIKICYAMELLMHTYMGIIIKYLVVAEVVHVTYPQYC